MATKINAAVIFASIDNLKVNYSVYRYACSVKKAIMGDFIRIA